MIHPGSIFDGLIGEGWSGTDPNGAHVNVVLAERGTSDRRGAGHHVHLPRSRPRPHPRRRRRGQGPLRAGLAADDHDQQGDRARAHPPEDHVGRGPARHRPGRARRRRRGAHPRQRRPDRVRRHLHRSRRARRDRGPRRQPRRDAQGRAHRPPRAPGGGRAGARRPPRQRHQPVLQRRREDHRHRARAADACRSHPPFHAAWDPDPRTRFDATLVRVHTDEGVTGIASGDTMDGFEAFAHLFVGRDPLALPPTRARSRRSRFTPGATGRWRPRCGTWPDGRWGRRWPPCWAAPPTVCRCTPRSASCAPRRSAPRTPGRSSRRLPGRQGPHRPRPHPRGHRGRGRDARRGRRRAGDHGRPQPVVADGRRHRARAWVPRRRAA